MYILLYNISFFSEYGIIIDKWPFNIRFSLENYNISSYFNETWCIAASISLNPFKVEFWKYGGAHTIKSYLSYGLKSYKDVWVNESLFFHGLFSKFYFAIYIAGSIISIAWNFPILFL